jgi:hypothetical protein
MATQLRRHAFIPKLFLFLRSIQLLVAGPRDHLDISAAADAGKFHLPTRWAPQKGRATRRPRKQPRNSQRAIVKAGPEVFGFVGSRCRNRVQHCLTRHILDYFELSPRHVHYPLSGTTDRDPIVNLQFSSNSRAQASGGVGQPGRNHPDIQCCFYDKKEQLYGNQ